MSWTFNQFKMKTEVLSSTLANVLLHTLHALKTSLQANTAGAGNTAAPIRPLFPTLKRASLEWSLVHNFPAKKKKTKRTSTCVNSTTILIISIFEAICPLLYTNHAKYSIILVG